MATENHPTGITLLLSSRWHMAMGLESVLFMTWWATQASHHMVVQFLHLPSMVFLFSSSADFFCLASLSDSTRLSFANNRTIACFHFHPNPPTPNYFPNPFNP
jgi:hypothetical protein